MLLTERTKVLIAGGFSVALVALVIGCVSTLLVKWYVQEILDHGSQKKTDGSITNLHSIQAKKSIEDFEIDSGVAWFV